MVPMNIRIGQHQGFSSYAAQCIIVQSLLFPDKIITFSQYNLKSILIHF
uniref:Uncharacterized protein n=1 Tax=Anguilla anguilla TaxID=7936 RepID=A0A0E9W5T8_ANGAN